MTTTINPSRLRLARHLCGRVERSLARDLGVPASQVFAWERGLIEVPATMVDRIALALSVTPAFLRRPQCPQVIRDAMPIGPGARCSEAWALLALELLSSLREQSGGRPSPARLLDAIETMSTGTLIDSDQPMGRLSQIQPDGSSCEVIVSPQGPHRVVTTESIRAAFGKGTGIIGHPVRMAEAYGVVVLEAPPSKPRLPSIALWSDHGPAIVLGLREARRSKSERLDVERRVDVMIGLIELITLPQQNANLSAKDARVVSVIAEGFARKILRRTDLDIDDPPTLVSELLEHTGTSTEHIPGMLGVSRGMASVLLSSLGVTGEQVAETTNIVRLDAYRQ